MCGYVGLLSVMWISMDKYICMQSVYIFVSVSIFSPRPSTSVNVTNTYCHMEQR